MKNKNLSGLGLLALTCALTACYTVPIASSPPGAQIYLDGVDTGKTTPSDLAVRGIPVGTHKVSVKKEGFHMTTPERDLRVKVDGGEIFWSVILAPLVVPLNLGTNLWKTFEGGNYPDTINFALQEGIAPKIVIPEKLPVPAVAAPAGKMEIEERLRKLEDLKKKGLISEKEYKIKRQSLIDQL